MMFMNPQDFISLKEEVLGIIVIARMITIAAFKRCTTNAYQSGRPDTLIQPKLLSKPAWSKAAETEIRSIHFSINAESPLYNRNRISQEACGPSRKTQEKLSAGAGKGICHRHSRCYQRNSGQGRIHLLKTPSAELSRCRGGPAACPYLSSPRNKKEPINILYRAYRVNAAVRQIGN